MVYLVASAYLRWMTTLKNLTTRRNKIMNIKTITDSARYQSDPLSVYQLLCQNQDHNILLESAEIDKKHLLKSLLLTDAAVKIVCNGNIVTFTALSNNGQHAVDYAAETLADKARLSLSATKETLTATFAEVATELDEKSRLTAINPLESLRLFNPLTTDDMHPLAIFLGGAFAFDLMTLAEDLPHVAEGENSCPDFVYYLAQTLVVIDHEKQKTEIIGNIFTTQNDNSKENESQRQVTERIEEIKQALAINVTSEAIRDKLLATEKSAAALSSYKNEVQVDISDKRYCQIVEQLKENISAGDIFQVVPSRTFTLPCTNSISAYRALKISNPSPYMFYLKDSEFCIFGASPESAIKYQAESPEGKRQVEIYPIAGTRSRGFDKNGNISLDLDSRIELELRQDKKESAEHIMLVDLARNDIARVSEPGTRYVADLLKVDRYSHVMHLVSRVCGTLKSDLDALHAYQACMNMGTLSGAPKVKATSLIREVEGKRRGSYGGAVGYLTGAGEMDTCIVIRSAFVKNNIAQVQAGAGVVYDSDPISEANETRQKAQAVINAINQANAAIVLMTNGNNEEQTHD